MRIGFLHRRIVARERNVVRVDFAGDPEPPAPRFPGAGALRAFWPEPSAEDWSSGLCEARAA